MRASRIVLGCVLALFAVQARGRAQPVPPPAAPAPATAAPAATIDISTSVFTFEPSSSFGPWDITTIAYRAVSGNQKPGISFTTRSDRDGAIGSSGTYTVLDDYDRLSSKAFLYGSFQVGGGSIYPDTGVYLEGDVAVANRLVIGAGGGFYHYPSGLQQHYVSVGPTLYFPGGTATVRFEPIWTQGQVAASSTLAAIAFGQAGRELTTLSVQYGVQPTFSLTDPSLASRLQYRAFVADLSYKHWLSDRLGYDLGYDYGILNDLSNGSLLYRRMGFTAGVFVGVGHASSTPW